MEREKRQTEMWGEKERGKAGWEPKKWYDILIMACPDIDGNAGAHVHTRSKTPCKGLP